MAAQRAAAIDRAHELESEIVRAPARSVAGAAVKLKMWMQMTIGDEPVMAGQLDLAERAIVSALGDLERMIERAA